MMLSGKHINTGNATTAFEYDSDDDPESIINRRISVKWSDGKWWSGIIKAYDPEKGTHHIQYDDGDEKDYELFEKCFKLLKK